MSQLSSANEPPLDVVAEAVVKSTDMPEEMQQKVFQITQKAFDSSKMVAERASVIKKELDKEFGTNWQVVVGKSYGIYSSHEVGGFIYFFIGNYAVVAFRTA